MFASLRAALATNRRGRSEVPQPPAQPEPVRDGLLRDDLGEAGVTGGVEGPGTAVRFGFPEGPRRRKSMVAQSAIKESKSSAIAFPAGPSSSSMDAPNVPEADKIV